MKYLVLAEKPDQAKKYANALGQAKNQKGVWKVYSDILRAEVLVAPAVGHLVEKVNPYQNYENWQLENLPALPDHFDYAVKTNVKKNFANIKQAVKEVDAIIIGTDPDREGEAIAYKILKLIPGALQKIKYRLWANSLTNKGITDAFKRLRQPQESINYYHEADARDDADWLVGFNLSPFVTIKMKEKGLIDQKEKAMSVGRVQTPIVSLIVKNDEEIASFVSQLFWKLEVVDALGATFSSDVKYQEEDQALSAFQALSNQMVIKEVSKELKKQTAPKLYNLTAFQSEMSKLYQYDATKTKEIIQSLYQKGFLSYPRTDSRLITHNEFSYLVANIEGYQVAIGKTMETPNRQARFTYVNDKKVVEHYAIIPTENIPNLADLSDEEQLIYKMVVYRTLLMFTADYEYESTSVVLVDPETGVEFKASGTVTKNQGWRVYMPSNKKDTELPAYQEGQSLSIQPQIKEDMTKPHSRITEQSLLKTLLPKYNLGTSATRDGILDLIQEKHYVTKDKKSGQFTPTERGRSLIHFLDQLEISYTNPETTGKWEQVLGQIGQGKIKKEDFVNKIKWAITQQIQKGKEML